MLNQPGFSSSVVSTDFKNMQVTAKGKLDVGNAFWAAETENAEEYMRVRKGIYHNSQSAVTYIMADVPALLLEKYPELANENLGLTHTFALDIEPVDSYDELLHHWFSGEKFGPEYYGYTYQYIYPESNGGRIAPVSKESRVSKSEMESAARGLGF